MNTSRFVRGRIAAVGLAVCLLGGTAPAVAHADAEAPSVPSLRWTDCGDGFQCATAKAPLDYAKPRGRSISLALIRWPAADQKHRIGSLFVNPGGPGGSGVSAVRQYGQTWFAGPLHDRFDLVGFDPRGIGASTQVRCFASEADEARLLTSAPPFPLNATQNAATAKMFATLSAACGKRDGEILRHVTTADAARDLDLLRAAVGDKQVSFYGLSYGTYYAAVYANMFPTRVRAIVADGVVDPTQWSGDQRTWWYRTSAPASERALDAFAADCAAAGPRCAFGARDGKAVRARINTLLAKLRARPVTLPGKPAQVVTYQSAVGVITAVLYQPAQWVGAAWWLAAVEALANGKPATVPSGVAEVYHNNIEALFSIMCTDAAYSRHPDEWPKLLDAADRAAPSFGRLRLYTPLACATWPASSPDRYTGPFNKRTVHPVLVVGNTYDPVTPLSGARKLASLLPNSRLLTLNGYGHTTLLSEPSQCAASAIDRYLLSGQLPAEGTVCHPDRDPFDPGATPPIPHTLIGPPA